MTLSEFAAILNSSGLPVRYGYWTDEDRPTVPYIEYQCTFTENFGSDNKVHQVIQHIDVFLFTKEKNLTAEAAVEGVFDANEIFWNKTESYFEDERVYQILYEVSIYG